eukprot:scaffold9243_cov162-Amphora_coffeaeformis.AAC.5
MTVTSGRARYFGHHTTCSDWRASPNFSGQRQKANQKFQTSCQFMSHATFGDASMVDSGLGRPWRKGLSLSRTSSSSWWMIRPCKTMVSSRE